MAEPDAVTAARNAVFRTWAEAPDKVKLSPNAQQAEARLILALWDIFCRDRNGLLAALYWRGLSRGEIARSTGLSESTVRNAVEAQYAKQQRDRATSKGEPADATQR